MSIAVESPQIVDEDCTLQCVPMACFLCYKEFQLLHKEYYFSLIHYHILPLTAALKTLQPTLDYLDLFRPKWQLWCEGAGNH